MRVLLIPASHEFFPMYAAPIGEAYVAAILKKEGHEVEILDLALSSDYKRSIESALSRFKPEVIGMSIRNIDIATYPATIYFYPPARDAVRFTKEITEVPIILGGAGFSMFAEEILRDIPHDFGVVGEGEYVFAEIVKRIQNGSDPRKIPKGVCFIDSEGNFIRKEPWVVENLDELPLPARDLIDNNKYKLVDGRAIGNIQTQRGCPYKCIFCSYPLLEGSDMRYRSPKSVADEMELLVNNYGIKNVFIVDNSFNTNPSNSKDVALELLGKKLDFQWGANYKPDSKTIEYLPLFKESGCSHLALGVENLSDDVLDTMKKCNSANDVVATVSACTKLKIEQFLHILFGLPGETLRTVEKTLNVMESLDVYMGGWQGKSEALIMTGVRIYPHTELQKIAIEEGVISEDTNLLLPKFYISPSINESEMFEYIRSKADGNERWNVPGLDLNIPPEMNEFMQKQLRHYGIK